MIGLLAAMPLLGLALIWRHAEPRRRRVVLLQILGASAASTAILMLGSGLAGSDSAPAAMFVPVAIAAAVMAVAANRTVNQE